jgi:hypothetical protein
MTPNSYIILTADSHVQLEAMVRIEITSGWFPQGGVMMTISDYSFKEKDGLTTVHKEVVWAQAMVK